jgi:hypothetical protein
MVWLLARRHVACQHCSATVSVYGLSLQASRCSKYGVGAQNLWYQDNLIVWNVIWHERWIFLCYYIATHSVLSSEVCQFCGIDKMWESEGAFTLLCLAVIKGLHRKFFTDFGWAWWTVCPSHPPVHTVQTIWSGVGGRGTQLRPPTSTCSSISLVSFVAEAHILLPLVTTLYLVTSFSYVEYTWKLQYLPNFHKAVTRTTHFSWLKIRKWRGPDVNRSCSSKNF